MANAPARTLRRTPNLEYTLPRYPSYLFNIRYGQYRILQRDRPAAFTEGCLDNGEKIVKKISL
jgi:hypothetical protein